MAITSSLVTDSSNIFEIDRKTNLITGGYAIDEERTQQKDITPEFIQDQYDKLELQRSDESYHIWRDL